MDPRGFDPHDTENASTSGATETLPGCFLIVHNVSKRHNIGTLVRSAAAFGVTEAGFVDTDDH